VLLLQEVFGVNAHMRDVADFYAGEGYVVLAPDLFHAMEQRMELGYVGADLEKALGFYQRFDMDQADAGQIPAVQHLDATLVRERRQSLISLP
jgi:carboxymethylenebutenolidase